MTVSITFLGGPETGDVDSLKWGGGPERHEIVFPKGKAMTVNLDDAKNTSQRKFYEHVIAKARNNRFFKVTGDAPKEDEPAAAGEKTGRRKRGPNKPKAE